MENIATKLSPKVYIVLVNYNGWIDTIECLESVLKLDYLNYQIIVVDNNSPNNSLEFMQQWAEGHRQVAPSDHTVISSLVTPLVPKPISYAIYQKEEAEAIAAGATSIPKVILIQAGENGGFAAGNNIGIDFALERGDCEYVWLLNNDTVVDRNALSHLVKYFETVPSKLGILGSKLLYYHSPSVIQAIAGKYNPWLCTTGHIGGNVIDNGQYDSIYDQNVDYVVGASMFVCHQFLLDVGKMQEDYFLYFEELDWSYRGKKKGWSIDICTASKVYHKEGASISVSKKAEKSKLADYYSLRNRLLFTKRYFPLALPLVYLSFIGVAINRIKRKQFGRLTMLFRIILNKKGDFQ